MCSGNAHNFSKEAVISRLCLHRDPSESFVISLILYSALIVDFTAFKRVFILQRIQRAITVIIALSWRLVCVFWCVYCVSLAFLVRCQSDHKNQNNGYGTIVNISKQQRIIKLIVNAYVHSRICEYLRT